MQSRIVLVSDDSDFFEYISPKLRLRKSDELYRYGFDEIIDKLHLLSSALIIINSENAQDKTLELLEIIKSGSCIVFGFNENEDFEVKAYKLGMLDYITLLTGDEELEAKITSALNIVSTLEKNTMYREILVNNNLIASNNEVYIDYAGLLDKEIEKIKENSTNAVLGAISPDDKSKFLLNSNQIETVILNNIRKNDMLMNYAPNKYFILLFNSNIEAAEKIFEKIKEAIPEKIYAGFAQITYKNRQQLINEVLNKLHENINNEKFNKTEPQKPIETNFKFNKKEFYKKMENTITPVFYHTQQTYNNKLFGMNIEQETGDGYGNLNIKSRYSSGSFKITSPGQSKINIDIVYQANGNTAVRNKSQYPQAKRITIEPEEFEAGLLEDLLEQFITEFKNEVENDNSK